MGSKQKRAKRSKQKAKARRVTKQEALMIEGARRRSVARILSIGTESGGPYDELDPSYGGSYEEDMALLLNVAADTYIDSVKNHQPEPTIFTRQEYGLEYGPWVDTYRNLMINKYGSLDVAEPLVRFNVSLFVMTRFM